MTFRSIANSCLGDAAQARGLTYQLESPRALAPACQPTSFPAISFNTTYVLSRELSNHLWTNNLTVCLFFPVENALPLIVSFRKIPLILQCLPVCVLSRVQLFETPLAVARQAPLSMGFFRQESWSELPFPTPGDLPVPGIELTSPALQVDSFTVELPGKPLILQRRVSCSVVSDSLQPCGL